MPSSTSSLNTKRPGVARLDVSGVELTPEQVAELKTRCAREGDYRHVITPGTEVWLEDQMVAGFYELEEDATDLTRVVEQLPFIRDYRTSGMRTRSAIFGFRPREALRKDYCAPSSMLRTYREGFAVLDAWAKVIERYYAEAHPDIYAEHKAWVEENVPEMWRMTDSIFTSGIANKDTSHYYHKDNGNVPNTWNAMLVLSNDIRGGETVIPELGVAVKYDGRPAVLTFPAESTWHGVMPLHTRGTRGYRYSLVFYTLQQMCHCGTAKEELKRIRKLRTERENHRVSASQAAEAVYKNLRPEGREWVDKMRESGELDRERTLEERVAHLREKAKVNTRAAQVLKRLERKLKKRGDVVP